MGCVGSLREGNKGAARVQRIRIRCSGSPIRTRRLKVTASVGVEGTFPEQRNQPRYFRVIFYLLQINPADPFNLVIGALRLSLLQKPALVAMVLSLAPFSGTRQEQPFDHYKHTRLFSNFSLRSRIRCLAGLDAPTRKGQQRFAAVDLPNHQHTASPLAIHTRAITQRRPHT